LNKKKIINDPVYGFITIKSELVFDIIEHPWFQRLRRIRQLGLAEYIFPGAIHTRFQHALGAMHLMGLVLDSLRQKEVPISEEEYEAAQLAILLHDIGHGPLSHTFEETLIPGVKHESLSYLIIRQLNKSFGGALDLTIKIFRNGYKRKFFHQLVSSQLDIDRLDYLRRDSFFTGVLEGTIGVDRIISMLTVHRDQLVVEEKGIYSVENFLNARRFMYWQVYLHKTSVSAERMTVNLMRRAVNLVQSGDKLPCSDSLMFFLKNQCTMEDINEHKQALAAYTQLDDYDIWGAVKQWKNNSDKILSTLSSMVLDRDLFKIILSNDPIKKEYVEKIRSAVSDQYKVLRSESNYLFSTGKVSNEAYTEGQKINILMKSGELIDLAQASDLPQIKALSKIVQKNYLCWPKTVSL
jgi:HD superfamily phosphohydrolase